MPRELVDTSSNYPFHGAMDESKRILDDGVNHPSHYGGKDNPYETIKIWKALGWLKDTCKATAIKYIMRAGKKSTEDEIKDLKKARFYIDYLINDLENEKDI